jgi:hypothetical protein
MRMTELKLPNGQVIYVNPDHVRYVRTGHQNDKTSIIYFDHQHDLTVDGPAARVAQDLARR